MHFHDYIQNFKIEDFIAKKRKYIKQLVSMAVITPIIPYKGDWHLLAYAPRTHIHHSITTWNRNRWKKKKKNVETELHIAIRRHQHDTCQNLLMHQVTSIHTMIHTNAFYQRHYIPRKIKFCLKLNLKRKHWVFNIVLIFWHIYKVPFTITYPYYNLGSGNRLSPVPYQANTSANADL